MDEWFFGGGGVLDGWTDMDGWLVAGGWMDRWMVGDGWKKVSHVRPVMKRCYESANFISRTKNIIHNDHT
jgi:hypothetical protein